MMDLALSLGETLVGKPEALSSSFHEKPNKTSIENADLGFCCMAAERRDHNSSSDRPPVQLDLMPPFSPVHTLTTTTCSRGSSDIHYDQVEENGLSRKKLRLSKEQSAFLEDSFKENNTLNPKQKVALAKQLNLRTRQVQVWFQNRRARRKLKQTGVDCEYLKRCCNTLTEENQRLQKELQELLRAHLKPAATTLTVCPSCERIATTPPPPATAKPMLMPKTQVFV